MNETIQKYANNQNCKYYNIFRNNNFQCNCNKIFIDNYRKSKIEILNILRDYKKELLTKQDEAIKLNNNISSQKMTIRMLEDSNSKYKKDLADKEKQDKFLEK